MAVVRLLPLWVVLLVAGAGGLSLAGCQAEPPFVPGAALDADGADLARDTTPGMEWRDAEIRDQSEPAAQDAALASDAGGPDAFDSAHDSEIGNNPGDAASDAAADSDVPSGSDTPPPSDADSSAPTDSVSADSAPGDAATGDTVAEDTVAGDTAQADTAEVTPPGPKPLAAAATQAMQLTQGAFAANPAYPSALLHAPKGFVAAPPYHVVVYLHGHYNCATTVLGDIDAACAPGGTKRSASKLAVQLAAAGRQALLLVPELAYDKASSDAGTLATNQGFAKLLAEVGAKAQPPLPPFALGDVASVTVVSHSGGYKAAAGIATQGGVPVREVWLLDSLYAAVSEFKAWIQSDIKGLGAGADWQRRFADVYTAGGGTAGLSQQLATSSQAWVPAGAFLHDPSTATWPAASYDHGLLFKKSGLSHHGVTLYYFQKLLETSHLPKIP